MQSYVWEDQYTCILLRWCIGYLSDAELVEFLKMAYRHLEFNPLSKTRCYVPSAFIIVLETVGKPGYSYEP